MGRSQWQLRFALPEPAGAKSDRLVEMVRRQIQNLLEIVVLTCEGREVGVDGFRFVARGERVHPIGPDLADKPGPPPEERR